MKLWVDDIRPAPKGYFHIYSVNQAKDVIHWLNLLSLKYGRLFNIEVIDMDHDAGDHACEGGDFINILNWMEENRIKAPIHIHSLNAVGVQNMRRIMQKNGWKEV